MENDDILGILLDDITLEILKALEVEKRYVRELIRTIKRNPNAVVKRVRILERYGLIKSVREEKRPRRKILELTTKGLEILDTLYRIYDLCKR